MIRSGVNFAWVCLLLQKISNNTRNVFALHASGYLFPVSLTFKPVEGAFACIVQKQHWQCTDNFILFATGTLTVMGANLETMLQLGVSCVCVCAVNCD